MLHMKVDIDLDIYRPEFNSRNILKYRPPVPNLIKILRVVSELKHADGRTDRQTQVPCYEFILWISCG
jgi:hypothetical protein